MIDLSELMTRAGELTMQYIPKVLLALVTLVIGLWLIKLVDRISNRTMEKAGVDTTLQKFLSSMGSILLKVMLFISVASMIGIEMTTFVAVLAAAGLAVGLALQGSLANFAGGVMIILFKPFKVGDFIEAQGHMGVVESIEVFITSIKTIDNKVVIMPNGPLSNGNIVNYTAMPERRVDLTFGISYRDDIATAKLVFNQVIKEESRILITPAPQVVVSELGDSSVNFFVRAWVKTEDYWDVYFSMQEKVKLALERGHITIPFPQRDVHMYKEEVVPYKVIGKKERTKA